MQPGQLIVITGPSGVGKGTLVRHLLTRFPNLYLSVSATTRPPRPGEIEGEDYYFLDRPSFEEKWQPENFSNRPNTRATTMDTPISDRCSISGGPDRNSRNRIRGGKTGLSKLPRSEENLYPTPQFRGIRTSFARPGQR